AEADQVPAEREAPEEAEAEAEAEPVEAKAVEREVTKPEPRAEQAEPKKPAYGRRGRRGTRADGPPPLLPGQVVGGSGGGVGRESSPAGESAPESAEQVEAAASATPAEPTPQPRVEPEAATAAPAEPEATVAPGEEPEADETASPLEEEPGAAAFDADELGLPTDEGAVIRYLSNSYQGVGQKTAEALIEAFGADRVFNGLNSHPGRVREVLGSGRRTEALLEAWQRDYRRRTTAGAEKQPVAD
ncbi:MAG: hypothetical protein GWM90_05540, partial [Gemmatimonadetes bacterium]|nr:hypothetical protein [Gemmatimonadota bacterium]NIQ53224.1 hypothetical protein [Gemmatimonadota bacterium]NIU73370.1 hypothetical protein [Gammaproteobacteria bacterium]NIX43600.1 hypothetical protein [Gemmatimonadota bacterium]NIY07789.1 hypothetical protein [Gemmatimonadota bacterium]